MPKWTTHTEGGSWTGGGTEVRDCNSTMQKNILDAFNSFIDSSCLDCFPGLRDKLRDKWEEIEIDCTDDDCDDELAGRSSGNKILICVTSRPRIDAVMLHELVHAVGGTELDSEAVEHACFAGNAATLPFGDDWDKFRGETDQLDGNEIERVGEFVIWNSDTGQVWGKETEGGGWGGGNPVKGSLCFTSIGWIHDYSGGGGWV